jgi:hypothetical protein
MTTGTGCSKVSTLATHLAEGPQQHLVWGRTPVIQGKFSFLHFIFYCLFIFDLVIYYLKRRRSVCT